MALFGFSSATGIDLRLVVETRIFKDYLVHRTHLRPRSSPMQLPSRTFSFLTLTLNCAANNKLG